MITHKISGVREVLALALIVAALLLLGASMTFAQTTTTTYTSPTTSTYTPPSGFQSYSSYGIYYNPSSGQYYNPMTGQYSTTAPLGPAARNQFGAYVLPAGYSPYGNTGSYYNSQTGYYYDPGTGFYSTTAPVYTGVTSSMIPGTVDYTGGTTFTPGVPNTGSGGDAVVNWTLLALAALLVLGGVGYFRGKTV